MRLVTEWLFKRPARAIKIYYGGGRKDSIIEKCIDCIGTSQEAKLCTCVDCALWTFRPGATKGEVPEHVPSKAELEKLAEEKVPDAVRENARKMGEARKK